MTSRGKRRIGYELAVKLKLEGLKNYDGYSYAVSLEELCDDGSDPEANLNVTQQGKKQQKDFNRASTLREIVEKCREILNIIKEEV